MGTPRPPGSRSLAGNVLWNLLGQGTPLLVAVLAIPPLIRALGTERFGLLSLAWVLVGYFSIFDLGIGRALTQLIAGSIKNDGDQAMGRLVWTSLALLSMLGIAIAAVLAAGSPWALGHFLKTPAGLYSEAVSGSIFVAIAVPFGVAATGLRGVLEARQAFFASNLIRLPLGALTYLAPLAVVPLTNHIDAICASLLVTRVLACGAYLFACYCVAPDLMRVPGLTRTGVRRLLSFSGWMAVTNVAAPFMTYLDRFLIGSLVSIAAVTYYATPFDVVTRLFVIPAAVTGVMFPAFATLYAIGLHDARQLFLRGVKYLALVIFPITLVFVTLARPGLQLWLGTQFADHSASVLQWLAVGVLFNSIGQVAFVLVQGAGRPRFTGLLNLIELPIYVIVLVALVRLRGIDGAAMAWTIRTGLDALVLLVVSSRLLNISIARSPFVILAPVAIGAGLLVFGALPMALVLKVAFLAIVATALVPIVWLRLLSAAERSRLAEALPHAKSG